MPAGGPTPHNLDCPICVSLLSDPRVTPCGHTICAACYNAHARRDPVSCPVCRAPLNGNIPYPNLVLKTLVDIHAQKGHSLLDVDSLDEHQVDDLLQRLVKRRLGDQHHREQIGHALMIAFLQRCHGEKKARVNKLTDELTLVEHDLQLLNGRIADFSNGVHADVKSRIMLVERFRDNVEKEYFERRRLKGVEGVSDVVHMLADATAFSAARRLGGIQHVDILRTNHNLISSIEFNAPAAMFATAGVTKQIKVFDFDGMLQGGAGKGAVELHHYPVLEIPTVSKLSCLSWNRAKHSVLAAATYKGDILVHDTETNTSLDTLREHSKRTWYVDFSDISPSMLLSGSDDHTVKLWDVDRHQPRSVLTLHTTANVCCVKFNPYDAHQVAFGSADHNVYSYDLRQPNNPLCVFEGHWKAVSHVLFLNRSELVSASTDSSCKLWDVLKQQPGPSYAGHANDRNFVGLTGYKDFFACGSEDNAVYVYHKKFSGPVVRYGFATRTGFVSTVAWKPNSNILVAASNTGGIDIFELHGSHEE